MSGTTLVLGASGFLGSHLCRRLLLLGGRPSASLRDGLAATWAELEPTLAAAG